MTWTLPIQSLLRVNMPVSVLQTQPDYRCLVWYYGPLIPTGKDTLDLYPPFAFYTNEPFVLALSNNLACWFSQEEKQLELALLRLFYNERDIDEITEEINRKNHQLEKENRKKDKIEDEIKEKKKEQGKLTRELTKVETRIKESVCISWKVKKNVLACIK